MAVCECLERCAFFSSELASDESIAEFYREELCAGGNSKCARYMVFREIGRENVPPNLYPPEVARARRILADWYSRHPKPEAATP